MINKKALNKNIFNNFKEKNKY